MVRKEEAEVFAWFRTLPSSRRVALMHGLLTMCLPLELRFLGTCLESLCQKDYAYLRDCEHRANAAATTTGESLAAGDDLEPPNPAVARSRLLVHLALLRATNTVCANALFRSVMERTSDLTSAAAADDDEENLLLLTFAFYHPAFTFEQKDVLYARLRAAQQQKPRQEQESSNACQPHQELESHSFQRGKVDVGDVTNCSGGNSGGGGGGPRPSTTHPSNNSCSPVARADDKSPTRPISVAASSASAAAGAATTSASAASDSQSTTRVSNATSSRSPSLTNVPLKAHIKLLELKSTHRRKGDRKLDYRIQVTWANGEVADITKSHQELCNFHQQLLHFLQDDTNVHRQERHVPYFTGPKQMIGNRTDELTEDSVNSRMADYLRQLMVKVPQHILNSNLVMGFFGAASSLEQDGGGESGNNNSASGSLQASSSKQTSVAAGNTFLSPTTTATTTAAAAATASHIMSHIQQQTSNFSSSSSLSSTSSASSPPPAHANNERDPTSGGCSRNQRDLSPPSQQFKGMTIYNSVHGDVQQLSSSSATAMTSSSTGGTPPPPTRQLQRRQSSKAPQSTTTAYGARFSNENDEGIQLMFRKDNLRRFWEQLRKKYSVKELLYLSEESLKNEGISPHNAKQILKIFDIVKGQTHNGIVARQPLLETPVIVCNANHMQPSSTSPPLQLAQTMMQQPPSCCTVHTCQTQVYMPTAPLEHLVRCSVPVSGSDSPKMVLHSGFSTTTSLPPPPVIQLPPNVTPCNGVAPGEEHQTSMHKFENLVSHSDVQKHNAPCDKVNEAAKEARFRRNGRNGGNAGPRVITKHVVVEENPTTRQQMQQGGGLGGADLELVGASSNRDEFLQPTNIPSVGAYSVCQPSMNSLGPDETNQHQQQPSLAPSASAPRKLSSSFPMQQQQQQQQQVPLVLTGMNCPPPQQQQQQRGAPPPRGHLCQNCPCTRTQATPPPPGPTTPTLPYSFMPFPIGGVFAPFQTAAGPTFLSPNSNGFVAPPSMPPPTYHQFIHSPDGQLVQADLATYSSVISQQQQQQQSGGGAGSSRSSVPGFVAGPSPNVGFHGAHLQSPPPATGVPPNGSCISLVGIGPPPNSNLLPKWSCYNCGQAGHLGPDCPEVPFDEVNKAGQFQLSFMSFEKPLEDFD